MKRTIFIITILVSFTLASALPTLLEGTDPGVTCSTQKNGEREFVTEYSTYGIGLFCPSTAQVNFYACGKNECTTAVPIDIGYKINGKLPIFTGLEKEYHYFYECFTCRSEDVPPTITGSNYVRVHEGDLVTLDTTCRGYQEAATTQIISGWMDVNVKQTTYTDAGTHRVTVTCADEFRTSSSKSITIDVIDRNRPPVITVTKGS